MKKYGMKIIRDNFEIIPTWDVTFGRFSTLAYELVIDQYLPGSFDVWKITFRDKCMTKYKNTVTGEVAYSWLTRYGVPVDDFDEEDKPRASHPYVVMGAGREEVCDSAREVARSVAAIIADSIRHYPRKVRRAA